jgi:hypothetical protein
MGDKKEVKVEDSNADGEDVLPSEAPKVLEPIKFNNPYTYEFLLERINSIIKKNNTYSSKALSNSSPKQRFPSEANRCREDQQAQALLAQVQGVLHLPQ